MSVVDIRCHSAESAPIRVVFIVHGMLTSIHKRIIGDASYTDSVAASNGEIKW